MQDDLLNSNVFSEKNKLDSYFLNSVTLNRLKEFAYKELVYTSELLKLDKEISNYYENSISYLNDLSKAVSGNKIEPVCLKYSEKIDFTYDGSPRFLTYNGCFDACSNRKDRLERETRNFFQNYRELIINSFSEAVITKIEELISSMSNYSLNHLKQKTDNIKFDDINLEKSEISSLSDILNLNSLLEKINGIINGEIYKPEIKIRLHIQKNANIDLVIEKSNKCLDSKSKRNIKNFIEEKVNCELDIPIIYVGLNQFDITGSLFSMYSYHIDIEDFKTQINDESLKYYHYMKDSKICDELIHLFIKEIKHYIFESN